MYILLITFHIIACLILIAVILLQAGRGGGLTEMGGETVQSLLGSQASIFLKKATSISAIVFLVTSLALGIVTARMGRSLFEQVRLPAVPIEQAPVQQTAETQ